MNKSPDSHQKHMLEHQALNPGTDTDSGIAGTSGTGVCIGIAVT